MLMIEGGVKIKNILLMWSGAVLWAVASVTAQENEFDWSGTVAAGDWVEISNLSGHVTAGPTPGTEVVISAIKSGRIGDFDLVEIEVVEGRNGIVVCVLYPQRRGGRRSSGYRGRNNPCGSGSNRSHSNDVDVDVDFEIRVPAGVNFRASTVSGDVTIEELDGDVIGNSVSGNVFVSTSGIAEATTVSGSIEIHLGRADWSGELSFRTVSGDVRVYFPEGLNTAVSFQSVSGDVESDFPITLRRRSGFTAGSLHGTIGSGGRELEITTVSGDLFLLVEN